MRVVLVAILLAVAAQPPSSGRSLPFSDKAWELQGDGATIAREGGRDVLRVDTGFGHRRDVRFADGTIDYDVQLTHRRSFVYVYFRVEADGEREEFYLRPHKSNLPDAAQYAPVWQGRSAWQLHHGPGGTAPVALAAGEWIHVRVVVQGRHAALFVKDMTTPALLVPALAREPRAGSIALGAFLPADVPGTGPVATFANVVVRPDVVPFDFAGALAAATSEAPAVPDAEVVRAWAVSKAFVPGAATEPVMPPSGVLGTFTRADTDPDGLLNLHAHVQAPQGSRVSAGVARLRVRAARAGTYTFDLGFSDIATVFVNRRPIFRGDASYSFDRPRRDGLIGFDQARLYLPLDAGDNEVAILVSDGFGGWGLMGRFVGAGGLTIEAPRDPVPAVPQDRAIVSRTMRSSRDASTGFGQYPR